MRIRSVSIIFVVVLLSLQAGASEWYENVSFVDNDPFQFDAQRTVLFPNSGLTLAGHPASGKLYAILPSAVIKQLEDSPKHLIVVDQHVLNAAEASSYRTIFHNASNSSQIPWIVGAIGAIPSNVTAAVGIASTLMDGISRYAQANQKVSATALEELMSTNGQFKLAFVLVKDPNTPSHEYVSSTVVYEVTVGGELRSYAICSSTFALKTS